MMPRKILLKNLSKSLSAAKAQNTSSRSSLRAFTNCSSSPQAPRCFSSLSFHKQSNDDANSANRPQKQELVQESEQDPPARPVQSYTQPSKGRPVMDSAQALQNTTYEGVTTVHDSTPDPAIYSMKGTDDPYHPTAAADRIKEINQDDNINSTLMREIYKNHPKSLDADFKPQKLPSGFKDQESGQVYYDTADKWVSTIPMRGLEDKFVDPDQLPPVEVTTALARCDGTNAVSSDLKVSPDSEIDERLGHPKVFIKLDRVYKQRRCPYCGVKYKRVPIERLKAEPFDVESMPEEEDNNEWFHHQEHRKNAKPRGAH